MKVKLCVLLLYVATVLASDEWLEVKTAQGLVRGRKHAAGGTYVFYNVPYATAPRGTDKFKVLNMML